MVGIKRLLELSSGMTCFLTGWKVSLYLAIASVSDVKMEFREKLTFSIPPFYFDQGSKIRKAARDICAVYGESSIVERITPDSYAMFKNRNFDLKDAHCSGCEVEFEEKRLNQLFVTRQQE
ncbi:hypothetical protein TNCV_4074201 [Trichonephila clavipes]|uniref:Mos1 transposase HTH domain-containing protein n=1 Tax=Trichonephila clavipes TaxID=2585209 RepID=A0A8X7BH27_TRICX|nr:hypothetical protein TNCV_4074201 [Trichonephila clavipes]